MGVPRGLRAGVTRLLDCQNQHLHPANVTDVSHSFVDDAQMMGFVPDEFDALRSSMGVEGHLLTRLQHQNHSDVEPHRFSANHARPEAASHAGTGMIACACICIRHNPFLLELLQIPTTGHTTSRQKEGRTRVTHATNS